MTKAAGERSKKAQNIELLKSVAVSVVQEPEKYSKIIFDKKK